MKCEKCGKEVVLPFTCTYCGKAFCGEHRLPVNHECPNQPRKPPAYISPASEVTPKVGLCPKCHFIYDDETMTSNDNIIAFDAETMTFRCKKCSFIFTQRKVSPYGYVEPTRAPPYVNLPISSEDQKEESKKKKHWWQ